APREVARGPGGPALVERDRAMPLDACLDALGFLFEDAFDRTTAIARRGLELDQIDCVVARQSPRVIGEGRVDPGGQALTQGDDANLHAGRPDALPCPARGIRR